MAKSEKKKEVAGFKIETYQREDGWWSFRINGEESHYRSSNENGLQRTIKALLVGQAVGTITLKAVKSKSGGMVKGEPAVDEKSSWATLPTQSERIKAFLKRGKLSTVKKGDDK